MSSSNIPTPSFLSGLFLKKKFLANPAEACLELSQTYGDIVRFSLSGNSFTLINSQSLIENILETNQGNYLHIVEHAPVTGFLSEDFYGKHNPELGDGLLSSLNRITIPETLPLFYPVIEEEVAVIKEQYRTSKTSADKINIELEMQRLFIKIIARGLLAPGLEINADSLQESMVDITSFNSFANLLKVRARSGTLPGKSRIQSMLPKYVVESFTYLDEMADHIGADFMGALAERSPFLEILHSHLKGHNTDYQKIIETIKATFITTSLPLSQVATWCLYNIDNEPGLRKKIEAEIENNGNNGNTPDQFPVLTSVILETLRVQPPLPLIHRFANSADSFGDYWINENSWIVISPYALHRNPRYWPTATFTPGTVDHQQLISGKYDYRFLPMGSVKASSEQFKFFLGLLVKTISCYISDIKTLFYDKKTPLISDAAISTAKNRMMVKIESKKSL